MRKESRPSGGGRVQSREPGPLLPRSLRTWKPGAPEVGGTGVWLLPQRNGGIKKEQTNASTNYRAWRDAMNPSLPLDDSQGCPHGGLLDLLSRAYWET